MILFSKFKRIFALLTAMVAFAAVAANDDVFVCCSTTGPDTYADGSSVVDGEAYALVYTKAGANFAGFQADGTLVDAAQSELVMVLPMAENGHCKPTLCVVSRTYASRRRTGTWDLFLLDTRNAAGRPAGFDEEGGLRRVNSWGRTASQINFSTSAFSSQESAEQPAGSASLQSLSIFAAQTTELAALPPNVPTPQICGITVQDGQVLLEVADTVPYLTYDVAGFETLGSDLKSRVGVEKRDGVVGETLVLEADGTESKFFKVFADR